jgi:4-hydroxy-3-methylbut-2-enyl diphosphate reductase IspH
MLNNVKDLDIEAIKNSNHIVITSGTSTPDELCDEIYQTILNI